MIHQIDWKFINLTESSIREGIIYFYNFVKVQNLLFSFLFYLQISTATGFVLIVFKQYCF
jgi:hypothetical protein